ncbi:MAG: hypothetical protein V4714_05155 [Bacteroidota bacterium]
MEAIDSHWTVKQAIKDFYARNNFGEDGGINEKWAWIKFGFFSMPIPNTEARRKNIYMHDVSHIVTGFDTNWKGESAVSAWEIASGGWGKAYLLWLLSLWAMGLGVVFYPTQVLKAFRKGLTMRNAFTSGLSKEEIFTLSLSDLRSRLSNQPVIKSDPWGWMAVSLLVFLSPLITTGVVVFILLNSVL